MDEKDDGKLLSDGEFSELMIAEYDAEGRSVDVLAKKRTWAGILARIGDDKKVVQAKKHNWWMGGAIAAAAGLLLTINLWQLKKVEDDLGQIKGEEMAAVPIPITLTAYTLVSGDAPQPYKTSEKNAGVVVMFKALVTQTAHIALLKIDHQAKAHAVVTDQLVEAGEEAALRTSDSIYGYQLESSDENLRFCGLAFASAEELNEAVATVEAGVRPYSVDGSCVTL